MTNAKKDFKDNMEKELNLDKVKHEVQSKKLILDQIKINNEFEKAERNEKELQIARNTNFGALSEDSIESLRKTNAEYIESARHGMEFICKDFNGVIPFFRKNLILIGGKTGEGKSTAVANIAYNTIRQKDPKTGKYRRVLVITNEEKSEDVYNRVTCLANGWHYTNHDKFTDEQIKTFDKFIPMLAKNGLLTVIDNNYNGAFGLTTTLEGICSIFDSLIEKNEFYDAIIIDYYQNIKHSKKNSKASEWEVQAQLANALDIYKNVYPAPIVVLAQVNPPDKEKKTPFEYRIKGRKVITDPSTFIVEMVADRENLRTEWIVHKSRFTEAVGKGFFTGYDKGKFVEYNADFQAKVNKINEDRAILKIQKMLGK